VAGLDESARRPRLLDGEAKGGTSGLREPGGGGDLRFFVKADAW
jgi:hypothetical protein